MILNSCEHGDSIVVYVGTRCPICEMEDENGELADSLSKLEDEYAALENECSELEAKLDELKTN